MTKNFKIIFGIIVLLLITVSVILVQTISKVNSIHVLTIRNDSLYVTTPLQLERETILLTIDYIDRFSSYQSPFADTLSFQELINKYIRNRHQDHYGTRRGSQSCRRIHEGIDFFVPENSPVYPLAPYGIVTEVSDDPYYLVTVECRRPDGTVDSTKIEYGKTVRILYPEGIESIYTHLNEVYVTLGQEVGLQTVVGLTGLTGNVRNSGKPSHLHMELRDKNNKSFDPRHRLHFDKTDINYFLRHLKIKD